MKPQILVIHGGDFFDTREKYFESLEKEELSKKDLLGVKEKRWKDNLYADLEGKYEVLMPRMPLADCARYEEWKLWLEKMLPYITDGIILIGTSLGGIFLERYLSENIFAKKIKALYLLAAPYFEEKSVAGFYTVSAEQLRMQAKLIHLFHSKDDEIVPFDHCEKYQKLIPEARVHVLEGRGHLYAQEHFPELVESIIGL